MVDEPKAVGTPPSYDYGGHDWALGSGRAAFFMLGGTNKCLPVLVGLDGATVEEFASGEKFFQDPARVSAWRSAVRVSPLFGDRYGPLKDINFVVALVTEEFFALRSDAENRALQQAVPFVLLGPPLSERHLPDGTTLTDGAISGGDGESGSDGQAARRRSTTGTTKTGKKGRPGPVVVGIIDDGIAFAHERFRNGDKTRIEYLWIQDGVPPSGLLPFGREMRADGGGPLNDINALLQSCIFAGQIDEDEVYRRSGVLDFARPGHKSVGLRATHGAAVMDIAAGDPSTVGCDDRPIIAVQLPTDAVRDTSLDGLQSCLVLGIFYILVRSIAVGRKLGTGPLPVVINLSFGNIAGPHDGTSWIERIIDGLLETWRKFVGPMELVLPSGNSHLSRCHAKFKFSASRSASAPRATVRLPWRVLPDDRTSSYLEIWLPHQTAPVANDRIRVRVIAPGGAAPANATDWIGETGPARVQYPAGGTGWCEIRYYLTPPPTLRAVFRIFLQPTASHEYTASGPAVPVAASGVWTVEIENILFGPDEAVEAWIQRDDTPFTYPRLGRQSYFDDPSYARFDDSGRPIEVDDPDCIVKRDGTINAIATGHEPLVIGGFLRKELRPVEYSSGGPVTKSAAASLSRKGPDALSVSDDSAGHKGVLAAGTRSGTVIAMSGTSIAAPRITRWVASKLAAGKVDARSELQNLANEFESGPPPLPPLPNRPDEKRGGKGRVLLNSVRPIARFWRSP